MQLKSLLNIHDFHYANLLVDWETRSDSAHLGYLDTRNGQQEFGGLPVTPIQCPLLWPIPSSHIHDCGAPVIPLGPQFSLVVLIVDPFVATQ